MITARISLQGKMEEIWKMTGFFCNYGEMECSEFATLLTAVHLLKPVILPQYLDRTLISVISTKSVNIWPEDERKWLSNIPSDKIKSLLVPYDEKAMEAHTVSKLITTGAVPTNVPES